MSTEMQELEDRLNATTAQLGQAMTALIATQAQNMALVRQVNQQQEMLAKAKAAARKEADDVVDLPLPAPTAEANNGAAATH